MIDNLDNQTKRCPFCNEEINAKAIKCKHCHSMLVDGAVAPASAPPVVPALQQPAPVSGITKTVMYTLSAILPFIGLVAGFVYRAKPNPLTKKFGKNLLIFSVVMLVINFVSIVWALRTFLNYYRSIMTTFSTINSFQ